VAVPARGSPSCRATAEQGRFRGPRTDASPTRVNHAPHAMRSAVTLGHPLLEEPRETRLLPARRFRGNAGRAGRHGRVPLLRSLPPRVGIARGQTRTFVRRLSTRTSRQWVRIATLAEKAAATAPQARLLVTRAKTAGTPQTRGVPA